MQYFESKRLREERQDVVAKIHEMARKIKEEGREFTPEEFEKFDKLNGAQEDYNNKIKSAEAMERAEALIIDTPVKPHKVKSNIITRQDHENALRCWAMSQAGFVDLIRSEHYEAADRVGLNLNSNSIKVKIARTVDNDITGDSNAENKGLIQGVESAMETFGALRQAAQVVRTTNGNILPWVTEDDTANDAVAHDKGDTIASVGMTLSKVELGAYSFASGVYPVPIETLMDTGINLSGLIADNLGRRLGRKENYEHTLGAGTTGPKGITVAVPADTWFYDDSATDWYSVFVDLKSKVDVAYRVGPKVGWMFADSILTELQLLTDENGRPLWTTSMIVGAPDKILNYPYWINNDYYGVGDTGEVSLTFGDFSKFIIRDVGEVMITVLKERFAEKGAVGFVALHRTDSDCINTNALVSAGSNTGSLITLGTTTS